MVMGSSAATSGSCSGSGGAEEGREGGEGDREGMVFFIGRFNLLFALGLVWFAVLRGFRVVGCVGLICVSCFGFAVSRLRGPIGYHGWRIMLVCCNGSWTGKSRCQIASELCEFVSTVRRSEVEVDAERLPSKRVPD
jgi:hypothetical protein